MWIESGIASSFTKNTTWGTVKKCGNGNYVYGFANKMSSRSNDPLGLHYILMRCKKADNYITDWSVTPLGKWQSYQTCPNYMVGFQLQMCDADVGEW